MRIEAGDISIWTGPWGKKKAVITAVEDGLKQFLYHLHLKYPDQIEIMVDDEDFSAEDLEGAFSIIVDPSEIEIVFIPGGEHFFAIRTRREEK